MGMILPGGGSLCEGLSELGTLALLPMAACLLAVQPDAAHAQGRPNPYPLPDRPVVLQIADRSIRATVMARGLDLAAHPDFTSNRPIYFDWQKRGRLEEALEIAWWGWPI